ncbi:MAG: helix-turn-helix transcriptional regulator [Clostridia bacterium]|nr:helix-turn-helix transcriptional regulator [Clostridia bacterium]
MDTIDYVSMGKRIRKYRISKNMTQSDLAEAVQRSNTTISHIEVGSGKPELNTVVRIANVLGVSMDMLLCDSLDNAVPAYSCELMEAITSCSSGELRFLASAIPSLLEAYRNTR